jgi:predicted AAA+ superfamily ATPase
LLHALFHEGKSTAFSGRPRDDVAARVLAGGYPDAVARADPQRRRRWFDSYIAQIMDRDAREAANIDHAEKLSRLLSVLAEHAGQLVNHSSYGAALGLSSVTAARYVGILERLFLAKSILPWSSNRLSRLVKSPKIHFLDSGLLAALRDDALETVTNDRKRFGPLLETFAYTELLKLASFSDDRYAFSHFRTRDGEEVDLVIEDRRGRVLGVEVKASATVRASDFTGLKLLREAAGAKFVRGVIFYDHDQVVPFGDGLLAAPLSALWAH